MTTFSTFDDEYGRNFFAFMRTHGKKMSRPLVFAAVLSYCVIKDKSTPRADILLLAGSLAYLLLPTDLVPDFILIMGWTDDILVIRDALKRVAKSIKPVHFVEARQIMREWGF